MLEQEGRLVDYYLQGAWVCVPTNGTTNKAGRALVSRGIAKELAAYCPELERALGARTLRDGHRVHLLERLRVVTFPTRVHCLDPANLVLIRKSALELMQVLAEHPEIAHVYLTRPGCGIGGLTWHNEVRPTIAPILDDRVVILSSVGRPSRRRQSVD